MILVLERSRHQTIEQMMMLVVESVFFCYNPATLRCGPIELDKSVREVDMRALVRLANEPEFSSDEFKEYLATLRNDRTR